MQILRCAGDLEWRTVLLLGQRSHYWMTSPGSDIIHQRISGRLDHIKLRNEA